MDLLVPGPAPGEAQWLGCTSRFANHAPVTFSYSSDSVLIEVAEVGCTFRPANHAPPGLPITRHFQPQFQTVVQILATS